MLVRPPIRGFMVLDTLPTSARKTIMTALASLFFMMVTLVGCAIAQQPRESSSHVKNQRAWSPDGSRLVFFLPWDGEAAEREVFVVNRDGSGLENLTCNDREDANPAWSPDGDWVAYFSRIGNWLQVVAVRPDGSERLQLTDHPSHNHSPEWSPSGTEFLFESNRDGTWELYRSIFPTGESRRVTATADRNGRPSWLSREKVVYYSDRDGDDELFLLDLQSLEINQLTWNEASDYNPSWFGPNAVLFVSDRDGDDEIFHLSLGAESARQLTFNEASEWNPYASPDGTTISFYSDRDGEEGLYLMDADGKNQRRLVSAAQVGAARCRPIGE